MSLRKSYGKGSKPRKYSKRVFDKNYGDIKWLSMVNKQDNWIKRIVKKLLPICFILFLINDCYGMSNVVGLIEKQLKNISYEARNYHISSTDDIGKVGQTPSKTKDIKRGNCIDYAIITKDVAQKLKLKAEYKIVNNGKHVVVVVRDGVREYKFSNGKRRL